MTTEKVRTNKHGRFVLVRHDERVEFECERCRLPKVAKIVVTWHGTDGQVRRICNGCHGFLLSTVG